MNTRKTENPIGELRFLDEAEAVLSREVTKMSEAARRSQTDATDWWNDYVGYYPIYPSFDRTLELLKEEGIEPERIWEKLDVQSILVSRQLVEGDPAYREEEEYRWQGVTRTYQEEESIRQILETVTIEDYNDMNAYTLDEGLVQVSITLNLNNREETVKGYFLKGTMPSAVEADLEREVQKEN